jgi:multidrug transporter EmrE-like cation transporter
MELHQKLTILGVILLIATFIIQTYHEQDHPGIGFNYAYVTGIAMLIVFVVSFLLFNKDKLKDSKK